MNTDVAKWINGWRERRREGWLAKWMEEGRIRCKILINGAWLDRQTEGWTDGLTYGWRYRWMEGRRTDGGYERGGEVWRIKKRTEDGGKSFKTD